MIGTLPGMYPLAPPSGADTFSSADKGPQIRKELHTYTYCINIHLYSRLEPGFYPTAGGFSFSRVCMYGYNDGVIMGILVIFTLFLYKVHQPYHKRNFRNVPLPLPAIKGE